MLLPPVNQIFSREISCRMPRSAARCDRVAEIPLEWNLQVIYKFYFGFTHNKRTLDFI